MKRNPIPDEDLDYLRPAEGAELEMLLVFNLMRTYSYLAPFIDENLRAEHLTSAQLNTLLILRRAGAGGLLMGDLGRRLVVTKSNVTGLVDRLEQRNLVRRMAHRDRRATIIHLTPEGEALLARVEPAHAERMAELTTCLGVKEKKTLIALLSTLRRELRRRRGRGA